MSKKLVLITTLIFVVCALFLSATVTFITKEMNSNNVITFGDIKMKWSVTSIKNDKEEKVGDGENFDLTYNSNVNRNVKIENIGNHPMFVRVSFNLIGKNQIDENIIMDSLVNIKQNSVDWIYKDGWYYYKNVVEPNKDIEKLSVDFIFNIDEISAKYPGSSITLDINAEAVQSENNSQNVLDAEGWPTN